MVGAVTDSAPVTAVTDASELKALEPMLDGWNSHEWVAESLKESTGPSTN